MATINLKPDNLVTGLWLIIWVEKAEIIGRVSRDQNGSFRIVTQGPHWSPMKSFAGQSFDFPEAAAEEVRQYFSGR